jgi:hypothetical protein
MSTGEMVQEKQSAVMDGLTATMRDWHLANDYIPMESSNRCPSSASSV